MNTPFITKLAASSALVLTLTSGCSTVGIGGGSSSARVDNTPAYASKAAKKADKLQEKGKLDEAVIFAERAVEAQPLAAEYRSKLGHVYLAGGRFLSAEQAFTDAVELGDKSARTTISLALSRIALGRMESARTLLHESRELLPASDYGLALALLGDHDDSIAVLVDAIRNAPPSAQTRQNLALAYAFAGKWKEAQVMAAQDVSPQALPQRLTDWAQMARPGGHEQRVASILNVTPVIGDSGQPERLALGNGGMLPNEYAGDESEYEDAMDLNVQPVRTASLTPIGRAPTPGGTSEFTDAVPEKNVTVAAKPDLSVAVKTPAKIEVEGADRIEIRTAAAPASAVAVSSPIAREAAENVMAVAAAPKKVEPKAAAPVQPERTRLAPIIEVEGRTAIIKAATSAAAAPVRLAAASTDAARAPLNIRSEPAPKAKPAPAAPKKAASNNGPSYVVQLGAFSTAENARTGWKKLSGKYRELSGYSNASSTVTINGRKLYRLAAMGFSNKAEANSLCRSLKAKGSDCIVRRVDGISSGGARVASN